MDYNINVNDELYIKNVLDIDKMYVLNNYLYIYFVGSNESLNIGLGTQNNAKNAYNLIIEKINSISHSKSSEISNRIHII